MDKNQTKTESSRRPKSAVIIITAILLGILVLVGPVIYGNLKSGQNAPAVPDNPETPDNLDKPAAAFLTDPGVVISTDKDEYDKGEIIKISVENKLGKPFLYFPGGDRFWGIEYYKGGQWINGVSEKGGGYQLAQGSAGEACSVILYERSAPVELKPGSVISGEWDQKICPLGAISSATDTSTIEYINNGRYRLVFFYGFGIDATDPYALSDYNHAAYSDAFTVK